MTSNHSLDVDSIKQLNPCEQEYWSARELAPLLGYNKWERFNVAIQKAMIACQQTGNNVEDHFPTSWKVITVGKGAQHKIKAYFLSRLACYLVAMNGDSRKPEIAAAQVYFAVATRAHEIHQLREAPRSAAQSLRKPKAIGQRCCRSWSALRKL